MFGTGFLTFKGNVTEDTPRRFLQMLVDILPMNDEEQMFNRCEELLKDPIKGIGIGTVSSILHTLKPTVFPIVNGNYGVDCFWDTVAVIENKEDTTCFIKNCRAIRDYRNSHYGVKNYRVFDIASFNIAGNYGPGSLIPENEQIVDKKESEYWPTLEEYDPKITKEQWTMLLKDPQIAKDQTLLLFHYMLQMGGEATMKDLAERYGLYYIQADNLLYLFGSRVLEKTACSCWKEDPYDRQNGYVVSCFGRNTNGKTRDIVSWKLRDELKGALEEVLKDMDFSKTKETPHFDKNIILYGPPGTGKTYNTAIYAVAICTGRAIEDVMKDPYDRTMETFNRLKKENRVAFTTFHQSYGYEEFIEGIKPVVDEDAQQLSYTIESGVFKKFCEAAEIPTDLSDNPDPQIWFVRLETDQAKVNKDNCYKYNEIRMDSIEERTTNDAAWFQERFVDGMQIGDYVLSYGGRGVFIDGIGIIEGEPVYDTIRESYCWTRKVRWIHIGEKFDVREINNKRELPKFEISKMNHMKLSDLLSILPESRNTAGEPCVFIIDEINRGNISKIFGELITLIEENKRAGMPEAASAILPYSGEAFSVPANVHIIGTMNTADRSIALMDTALRRRFQFVEMMPDTKALSNMGITTVEGLNIADMLTVINERITYLYDREHTIGHAYFRKLAESPTVETLAEIFEKSVIPLLQEYFYEDYFKIQLVLGDNGKSEPDIKFIKDEDLKPKNVFKGSLEDIDVPEKKYTINYPAFKNIESYKQIL